MTRFSALFVDRDGTVIEDVGFPSEPERVQVLPGAAEALRTVRDRGVPVVMVTNQSGIARGRLDRASFEAVQAEMVARLRAAGAELDAVYVCPHAPDDACACRKPAPGLFERAAIEHGIDLGRALYVGDRVRDVVAGLERGGRVFIVETGAPVPDELPDGVQRARDLSEAVERAFAEPGGEGGA